MPSPSLIVEQTMMDAASLRQLTPAQRAQFLYQQVRADVGRKLWDAAMGGAGDGANDTRPTVTRTPGDMDIASLLTLLTQPDDPAAMPPSLQQAAFLPVRSDDSMAFGRSPPPGDAESARSANAGDAEEGESGAGLGINAVYRGTLTAAAARTGIPAEALAAIVHAEAAKGPDGRWLSYSRNPRSSAAGLGQFLSGTWKDEAQRPGTWLNALAQGRGWLNERGHLLSGAKSDLLALRYDPHISIEAIADYARHNLVRMKDAGIDPGANTDGIAKAAYFAHHLGVGDAIRFLKQGLGTHHAANLLTAQIGSIAASRRIAICGDAAQAHREWLMHYVSLRIRPDRFSAAFSA